MVLVLTIWFTKVVMGAVVVVGNVMPQVIMKNVISTNVVLSRTVMKLVMNVKNFPAQC